MNSQNGLRLLIFLLVGIGLVNLVINQPLYGILVLALIAFAFYLYKRPPQWLIRFSGSPPRRKVKKPSKSVAGKKNSQKNLSFTKRLKRRKRAFRVIDGNKKDPFRKFQ
ncbi:hypothetical protein [Mechercharimyces sp. CAU 1602]|uniref:hypothetical protein n=1 Tax=Mechercharimyces sp. CAU 1602 TaxID=2973933 RepID=UPI002161A592|nr:hypothetical protein [Mechercharimyces sp. CAU 1602]MCS1350755.1 hypothetical protein [Mechercharimyces sp. CAU 1602]